MHLVDLHVPTSHQSLGLNPDLRSLAATQTKHTTASDLGLRHCTTGADKFGGHVCVSSRVILCTDTQTQVITIPALPGI